MSDSLEPFVTPGQNTGVGSLSLLQGLFPRIEPRSHTLQMDSLPAEPQGKPKNTGVGSLSLLQGNLPNPGNELGSPALQADSLPIQMSGKLSGKQVSINRQMDKENITYIYIHTHIYIQTYTYIYAHIHVYTYIQVYKHNGYYSAIKSFPLGTTCIDLECIMLKEISQTGKVIQHMISLICGIYKAKQTTTQRLRYKCVVARKERAEQQMKYRGFRGTNLQFIM